MPGSLPLNAAMKGAAGLIGSQLHQLWLAIHMCLQLLQTLTLGATGASMAEMMADDMQRYRGRMARRF
jgi:hypothetical protein